MNQCSACKRPIRWAQTTNGRPMPLDIDENPEGNVVQVDSQRTTGGAMIVRVLTKVEREATSLLDETRFMPHHATCPKRRK